MGNPVVGALNILVAAGIGVLGPASEASWALYGGLLPDAPDRAIAIIQSGGNAPWAHYALDFPQLQALIRGLPGGYLEAHAKALAVKNVFLGMDPAVADGDDWWGATLISDIAGLGTDKQSRPLLSVNIQLFVAPVSVGNREVI